MENKPCVIATARLGSPLLSSCPWQWLTPGGNFCSDSLGSMRWCILSPGMFCPGSSSYRSVGRLLPSQPQHCLFFNILFLILDKDLGLAWKALLGVGAKLCPQLQLHWLQSLDPLTNCIPGHSQQQQQLSTAAEPSPRAQPSPRHWPGSPAKGHPVLPQTAAHLLGHFMDLLGSLQNKREAGQCVCQDFDAALEQEWRALQSPGRSISPSAPQAPAQLTDISLSLHTTYSCYFAKQ